jgi:hypothetical protein
MFAIFGLPRFVNLSNILKWNLHFPKLSSNEQLDQVKEADGMGAPEGRIIALEDRAEVLAGRATPKPFVDSGPSEASQDGSLGDAVDPLAEDVHG